MQPFACPATLLPAIFFVLALLTAPYSAADIYRCVIDGRTVLTDQPCGGAPLQLPAPNTIPSVDAESPKESAHSPVYNSGRWYRNAQGYKAALKTSKNFNVPILIYYQADWCKYCRKLEKDLLHRAAAKKTLRRLVTVEITPDKGARERALFDSMGGTGYPSIFIQSTPAAKPVKRNLKIHQNGSWRTMSPAELDIFVSRIVAGT